MHRIKNYKLLMVGTGELEEAVKKAIELHHLEDAVQLMRKIPNSDIWELYRMADVFVNLNRQEIFGMAILEAMYYSCKVVACHAPGPDFIIDSGRTGFLVNRNDEIVDTILKGNICAEDAHESIVNKFTWDSMASKIIKLLEENE